MKLCIDTSTLNSDYKINNIKLKNSIPLQMATNGPNLVSFYSHCSSYSLS